MFQVRRTFLLIVTFDLIFMTLLWIIYNQVCLIFNFSKIRYLIFILFQLLDISIDKAFQWEVMNYAINNSLFDVVVNILI